MQLETTICLLGCWGLTYTSWGEGARVSLLPACAPVWLDTAVASERVTPHESGIPMTILVVIFQLLGVFLFSGGIDGSTLCPVGTNFAVLDLGVSEHGSLFYSDKWREMGQKSIYSRWGQFYILISKAGICVAQKTGPDNKMCITLTLKHLLSLPYLSLVER